MIICLISLQSPIYSINKITLNDVIVADIFAKSIHENLAGDLTLFQDDLISIYFYPSENYFLVAGEKKVDLIKVFAELSKILEIEYPTLCLLPIKISFDNEMTDLCESNIYMDNDNNGIINILDWQNIAKSIWSRKYEVAYDLNQDKKINSIDLGLIYNSINISN